MTNALRLCLLTLGVSAVTIASSIFFLGAGFTAASGEKLFDLVSGWRGPASGAWAPTMDGELRFYAALWGAYGVLTIRTAINLEQRLAETPWLAGVFFVGGVGRILSRVSLGAPHPFFTLLMVIELALPLIMMGLWLGARSPRR